MSEINVPFITCDVPGCDSREPLLKEMMYGAATYSNPPRWATVKIMNERSVDWCPLCFEKAMKALKS